MEVIKRYGYRTIMLKRIDGMYHAFLRRKGLRHDWELGIEDETEDSAFALAKEFIDAIPQLDSWPV
jgi:hypothetical protein